MAKPKNTVELSITEEVKQVNPTPQIVEPIAPIATEESNFNSELTRLIANSYLLDKQNPVMELTASYLELGSVGQKFRGAYAGKTMINITDKSTGELRTLESVVFVNQGKRYINSGVQLVDELSKFNPPIGTGLEISLKEKNGNTKIYSISVLS